MIDIYAINLNQDGVINPDKVLIQDVPATHGMHILEPSVKLGIESSGSFNFSIQPDDIFYNQFMQLKTIILVDYDGENIFYGRVLTVDDGFYGEQKISCEGAISLLLDSYYPPKPEKERTPIPISEYLVDVLSNHNQMISPDENKMFYPGEVPGNYSSGIQNDQKIVDEEFSFGNSSWSQTKNVLEDLKSYYGGCWRTRYALDTFPDIGQYGLGNIDLNNRPVIHNPDGSISTEISFSTRIGNEEVLLPTVINGQIYTEEEAIEYYNQSGEYLGKFSTPAEAEQYAVRLHERQDWYYNDGEYYRIYLDWLDQYFDATVNPQVIEIGRNLINAGTSTEVDNIFTRIIPIGKKNEKELYITGYSPTTVTGQSWTITDKWFDIKDLVKVYTEEELSTGYHSIDDYRYSQDRYGVIWKIVSFEDMSTPETLFNAAAKWAKDNYHGSIESVSVTAIDLHMTGENITKIHVGDRVYLRFPFGRGTNPPIVTRLLTCLEIDYDLYNPENTNFRFGIPSMALTKNRRSSGSSKNKPSSYSGYNPDPDTTPETDDYDKWFNQVRKWLRSNKVWYNHNVPAHKQGGPTLRDSAGQTHPPYFWVFDPQIGSDGRGKILFWSPVITGIDSHGNITWGVDSQGRPRGSWLLREYSQLNDTLLKNHHIYDYVIYEYGLDLRTGLSVKMPAVTTDEDGNLSIFSGIFSGEGGGLESPLVKKIAEFLGVDQVLNVFNSDGLNIAKILGEDGTYLFAELDDQGNVKVDDQGNPVYVNIRDIHHDTQDLKTELEETGHKVDLLDGDVTLIGQKVGDETYGLIKTVADQGNTIASLSDDVVLIGQNVDQSLAQMTSDIAAMGQTVTSISSDVTVIGQTIGDNTHGLIKDLADTNATVTAISSDVISLGGDMTQAQADIARNGQSITAINSDILALTSDINAKLGRKSTVYPSKYSPTSPQGQSEASHYTLNEGDLWVENIEINSYTQAEDYTWTQLSDYNWADYYGSNVYQYRNGEWIKVAGDQLAEIAKADFDVTAQHLYYKTENLEGKQAEFEVTASQIRTQMQDNKNELSSSITQTAGQIRSEVQNTKEGLQSSITQTAGQIRSEVADSVNELQSSITQNANSISLVVEGTGENARIKPAQIVAAINNGESSIILSANHLQLDGLVHATDLTTDWLSSKIAGISRINANTISATEYLVSSGSGMGSISLKNAFTSARITSSGNTYTLQMARAGTGTFEDIGSFSRAVSSWSGSWSGSVLSITASPQNQSGTVGFGTQYGTHTIDLAIDSNGTPSAVTGTGVVAGLIDCPIKVDQLTSSSGTTHYTKNVRFNVNSLLESKSITANGTYNTFSSGKIGYNSVTVNVSSGGISSITATSVDPAYSTESNGNSIKIALDNGSETDQPITLTKGSWSSGHIAVNSRLGDSSGTLFNRVWITIPNASSMSNNATYNTNQSNLVGTIRKSTVTANAYLFWTVGGKKFHIVVNP